jgi:ABC-type multidrug transport system fused ATPase/permease subunit
MRDLRRLLFYLKPHRGKFALATVAMLFVGLLQSAIGALIVPIFDQALRQDGGEAQRTPTLFGLQHVIPDSGFEAWRTIAVLLVAFTVAKGVAEYFSTYLMARVGQESVLKLRTDMYSHLHAQSADFFERHRTNYLVSRLVGSAAAIETAVSNTLRDMLRESFTLACFLTASFYYSWRLTRGSRAHPPGIRFFCASAARSATSRASRTRATSSWWTRRRRRSRTRRS